MKINNNCLTLCLFFVFIFSATPAQAKAPAAPRPDSPDQAPALIDDQRFLYGKDILGFDLKEYLSVNAEHLLPFVEVLSHWCGYYSINPRLLLALIDMQSQLLTGTYSAANLDTPLIGLSQNYGFEEQVKDVLADLHDAYYIPARLKRNPDDNKEAIVNAASFALNELLSKTEDVSGIQQASESKQLKFIESYENLFPSDVLLGSSMPVQAQSAAPVSPGLLLQFPWQLGLSWNYNGVHTWTGYDGVMSSIDFARDWFLAWGDDVSSDFVVAAHAGTVTVLSSCFVRITAGNGWATQYYHLDNLQVVTGDIVAPNQIMGTYAGDEAQALCGGGSATGPHVHFGLLDNGAYSPLSGVHINGYEVHPGREPYDWVYPYFWMEKNGTRHYPHMNAFPFLSILNDPADPPSPCDSYQSGALTISDYDYINEISIACSDTAITAGSNVSVDANSDLVLRSFRTSLMPGFEVQIGGSLSIVTY